MATAMNQIYAVGDIQGCHQQLKDLLKALPKDSKMICVGDLVNRGPDSLGALRTLKRLEEEGRAECILGNHDLHLLARDAGIRGPKSLDTLDDVLNASDRAELIDWLRNRPMVLYSGKENYNTLFVHAGVLPQWDVTQTLELADELQQALRSKNYKKNLIQMYGNQPDRWSDRQLGLAVLIALVLAVILDLDYWALMPR